MTTGPTDGKVTTAAGGPDGMPLAHGLSEGLGPLLPARDGQARVMTLTSDDSDNFQGHWYSPQAVAERVAAERERCAAVARRWGETHDAGVTVNARNAADKIARGIEGPNVAFSGVPAGHSSNHPDGGTSAATQG